MMSQDYLNCKNVSCEYFVNHTFHEVQISFPGSGVVSSIMNHAWTDIRSEILSLKPCITLDKFNCKHCALSKDIFGRGESEGWRTDLLSRVSPFSPRPLL